ncbi:hypothetical protein JQ580_33595 [Bradyrhizobium japonicum]|uniref:hypothetical protein n=1 Tax=Bradyrhizobium japonicum TaxID=375 RepID=UPI001BA4C2A5|nr:hypothetical protein [Bradyrhizobium japonicum]MBR0995650.1 hypothetical protein [Bradyrhizobium japonicum]
MVIRFQFTETATGAPLVDGDLKAFDAALAARGMTYEDFIDAGINGRVFGSITSIRGDVFLAYQRPRDVDNNCDDYIDAVQDRVNDVLRSKGAEPRDIPGTVEAMARMEQLWGDGVPVYEAAVLAMDEFM